MDDAAAQAIAELIRKNASLQKISLYANEVGNRGAAELASAASVSKSLRDLVLGENSIGDDGGVALSQCLIRNESLLIDVSFNIMTPNLSEELVCERERRRVLLPLIFNAASATASAAPAEEVHAFAQPSSPARRRLISGRDYPWLVTLVFGIVVFWVSSTLEWLPSVHGGPLVVCIIGGSFSALAQAMFYALCNLDQSKPGLRLRNRAAMLVLFLSNLAAIALHHDRDDEPRLHWRSKFAQFTALVTCFIMILRRWLNVRKLSDKFEAMTGDSKKSD